MAHGLLDGKPMPSPDLVALANLHAALDSVLEIEALLERTTFPQRPIPPGPRLTALASEMRAVLVDLLAQRRRA